MIALSPILHTILSVRVVVEVVLQLGVPQLAVLYLLPRAGSEHDLLELAAGRTEGDALFLAKDGGTSSGKGRS